MELNTEEARKRVEAFIARSKSELRTEAYRSELVLAMVRIMLLSGCQMFERAGDLDPDAAISSVKRGMDAVAATRSSLENAPGAQDLLAIYDSVYGGRELCRSLHRWISPEGLVDGALRTLPPTAKTRVKIGLTPDVVQLNGTTTDQVADLVRTKSMLVGGLSADLQHSVARSAASTQVFVAIDASPLTPYRALVEVLYTIQHELKNLEHGVTLKIDGDQTRAISPQRFYVKGDPLMTTLGEEGVAAVIVTATGVRVATSAGQIAECEELELCFDGKAAEAMNRLRQTSTVEDMNAVRSALDVEELRRNLKLAQSNLADLGSVYRTLVFVGVPPEAPVGLLIPLMEANCESKAPECERLFMWMTPRYTGEFEPPE